MIILEVCFCRCTIIINNPFDPVMFIWEVLFRFLSSTQGNRFTNYGPLSLEKYKHILTGACGVKINPDGGNMGQHSLHAKDNI